MIPGVRFQRAGGLLGLLLLLTMGARATAAAPAVTSDTASRIDFAQGVPRLIVAGQTEAPLVFFFNSAMKQGQQHLAPQVELAAAAGVHIYSMPFVDWPWSETDEQARDYAPCTAILDRYIAADPQAKFLLRFWPEPSKEWVGSKRIPAGDVMTFADGSKGTYSDASDAAWQLFEENFRRMAKHFRATPYWPRLVAFQIGGMEMPEWFHGQYREKGPDLCEANQQGFREFLRGQYGNDAALATAWGRPGLTLAEARVPLPAKGRFPMHTVKLDPAVGRVDSFYALPSERDWVDYSRYASALTARRIGQCARLIKQSCGEDKLAVFFYGYIFDTCGSMGGHLATRSVLRMPEVDMLAAPLSYTAIEERLGGGAAGFMTAIDSVAAHGKLWMNEDDMRTHLINAKRDLPPWLNEEAFGKQTRSMDETVGCLERNMANILVHRAGTWWMDLIAGGSFQAPQVWAVAQRRAPLFRELAAQPAPYRPEVAVIVDEASQCYLKSDWDTHYNTLPALRNACNKTGVAVGYYYLDDLLEGLVPPCKAYVFANTFAVSDEQIETINQRLDRERATAIWQYAPGLIGERGLDAARSASLSGILVEQRDGKLGSRGSGKLEGLAWAWDGAASYPVSPRLVVTDARAEVLGRYTDGGGVSAAARQVGEHRSVLMGDFGLSTGLLRRLFSQAGAHVWTRGDEVVHTDGRILMVHSAPGGELTINLPAGKRLQPLEPAGALDQQEGAARAAFKPNESRWFRIADAAH